MRSCLLLFALTALCIGLSCTALLVKHGGKSDGPGALIFYIGAGGGLFFFLVALQSVLTPAGRPTGVRKEPCDDYVGPEVR